MSEPRKGPPVVELAIADDPAAWEAAGFTVEDGEARVGATTLRLVGQGEPRGIRSWTLGAAVPGDLDGLVTVGRPELGDGSAGVAGPAPRHPNGVTAIDHVVVRSPDRDRTVAALRDHLGVTPRRVTEHELGGRRAVQTFYVLGDLVLEVISRPDEPGDGYRDGPRDGPSDRPSAFWGLAFTTHDLPTTAAVLGERLGAPRDAVQPGRRIATLHGDALGVSVPVAFMTPRG